MPHMPAWLIRANRQSRAIAAAGEELVDHVSDALESNIAIEDPASPHFDPAFGFIEPKPDTDVPASVGSILTRLLDHHRAESKRLTEEINAIRSRADDAIATRETVRQHHEAAIGIWGAAQDARITAWAKDTKGVAAVEAVELPEAAE